MTPASKELHAQIRATLAELDAEEAKIDAEAKPHYDALEPLHIRRSAIAAVREDYLRQHSDDVAGSCEECGKVLLVGDLGSRPYSDETDMVFCADHGMSYGDLKASWDDIPPAEDDEDAALRRIGALEFVAAHVARGGSLADKIPPTEL